MPITTRKQYTLKKIMKSKFQKSWMAFLYSKINEIVNQIESIITIHSFGSPLFRPWADRPEIRGMYPIPSHPFPMPNQINQSKKLIIASHRRVGWEVMGRGVKRTRCGTSALTRILVCHWFAPRARKVNWKWNENEVGECGVDWRELLSSIQSSAWDIWLLVYPIVI